MTGKVTEIGAVMATGGVFGIALGAATLAISGISALMEKFSEDTKIAEEASKRFASVISDAATEVQGLAAQVDALDDSMLAIGRSAVDAKMVSPNV